MIDLVKRITMDWVPASAGMTYRGKALLFNKQISFSGLLLYPDFLYQSGTCLFKKTVQFRFTEVRIGP